MDKVFQIGEFCFRLIVDENILVPENFMLFARDDNGKVSFTYEVKAVTELDALTGRVLATRDDLIVYDNGVGESRLIGVKQSGTNYASYQEVSKDHAVIQVVKSKLEGLRLDTVFSSLLALERRMYECDSMVLHCAYLQWNEQAILFSAPSGVGKSTQAELWEEYRGGKTINGDRGLLRKEEGQWMVDGWPVCGSSKICYNKKMPIRAIVMLYQAQENTVRRLRPVEAFKKIYGQITVNGWNAKQGNQCVGMLEQLVQEVEVYELGCTISKNAVEVLEKGLKEDEV
ncbi:MAG: hypothetical protein K6G01_03605 [Eubacterium sp.]|nr:hypothetical protein [Eubacterium sp.]